MDSLVKLARMKAFHYNRKVFFVEEIGIRCAPPAFPWKGIVFHPCGKEVRV